MPTVFTAREIAEAAVEKEMKRRDFYANVTRLSTNPQMTKLFEFLTAEEERHVATFVKLRDGVPTEEVRPEEYDADMEAYMDSVVEERLYSKIGSEDFVQKAIDAKDVFRLAIALEKDAILFFWEFLPYVDDKDKTVVRKLMDEEKGHIRMLWKLKQELGH
jgi:rubrerythrin